MSNPRRKAPVEVESFEDRIDGLLRELELAVKWQRPSILFAIVAPDEAHSDAEMELEGRLIDLGQKVFRLEVKDDESADVASRLAKVDETDQTVFFVSGLGRGGGRGEMGAYLALNKHREYFIEHRIRIVFWLTEKEAIDLANHAPDYWAFRHRVLEFIDAPQPGRVLTAAPELDLQADTMPAVSPAAEAGAQTRGPSLAGQPEMSTGSAMSANLHLTLGLLHWRKGDLEKASGFMRTALEAAIALEDKWFEAECLNAIALVYTALGKIDEAIEAYKQAIRLAPDQISPWNNLGNLYARLERNDEAISAFEKAIEHKPDDAVSWNGLGNVRAKAGETDEAIAAYRKAIQLAPGFVYPWNGLGNVYASTGRNDEAEEAYRKATGLNGHLINPWIGLGNIFIQQGRHQDAVDAYRKAIEINPRDAFEWNELAQIYQKMGSCEEAVAAYKKVIELAPDLGWPYSNLGLVYCSQQKWDQAIPLFLKSLDLLKSDKEKAVTWNRLGDAYRRLDDRKNAMAAYQKAVGLDGESAAPAAAEENELPETAAPEEPAAMGDKGAGFETSTDGPEAGEPAIRQAESDDGRAVSAAEAERVLAAPVDSGREEASEGSVSMGKASLTEDLDLAIPESSQAKEGASAALLPADAAQVEAFSGEEAGHERKSAVEWNALGHSHLNDGDYDQAIAAYTKAIEAAREFSWPYINNLAMAHYHKGEHKARSGKKVRAVDADDEAAIPQRYEEPPTQPLPSLRKGSPAEDQEADEARQAEPGRHALAEGEVAGIEAGSDPALDAPELEGEMTDWLAQLEDGKAVTGDLVRSDAVERTADDEWSLPEESPALEDTAQTPARRAAHPAASATGPGIEDEQPIVTEDQDEPKDAYDWNELGNIHLKAGACDRAIAAYIKAVETAPDFGWPYSNLGLAYSHKGKYAEAIPLYRKSIELLKSKKEKAIAWNRMGDAYRRLNDHEHAVAAYKKAVELDSGTGSLLKRVRLSLLGNARA